MRTTSSKHDVRLFIFLIGIIKLTLSGTFEDDQKGYFNLDKGKALEGHVIETHHVTEPLDCTFLCMDNTQCFSMNYKPRGTVTKESDVCELNNTTRLSDPASYKNDSKSNHYYDMEIEESRSCLDYLRRGSKENGIYTITDINGDSYKVWCDLSSEPGSAWTLIMSYAFKNRNHEAFCRKTFAEDFKLNENTPNWEAYRLSLNRMKLLSSQSTHWRVTSSSYEYGIDYHDYLRVRLSEFDIMTFIGKGVCKKVEYINIRGIKASFINVPFWQILHIHSLHTDSSSNKCGFDPRRGAVSSENNFGFLCANSNPEYRASQRADSTNEHWFGGYL